MVRDINLDDYESIFDAVSSLMVDGVINQHSISDVIDFPIVPGDRSFAVKDLKQETENMKDGDIKYLVVSKESEEKNRVLRIDRYGENYVTYSNVSLDAENKEIEGTKKRLYNFSISDAENNYLQMYIEILYEIKYK